MNNEPTTLPRRGSWRVWLVLAGLATLATTGAVLTRSQAPAQTAKPASSFANSGDFAPTYYLHSDAPLYYYYAVYDIWAPVWSQLTADTSRKVRTANDERIFDAARLRVRAWEKENVR